jgi:hypothetical protein
MLGMSVHFEEDEVYSAYKQSPASCQVTIEQHDLISFM